MNESTPARSTPSIRHTPGSVICSSADRHLYVFRPYLHATPLLAQIGPFASEPTKIDYVDGELVCGFSDGTIGIWTNPIP